MSEDSKSPPTLKDNVKRCFKEWNEQRERIAELEKKLAWYESGVHTCNPECPRETCIQHRRIEELEAQLESIKNLKIDSDERASAWHSAFNKESMKNDALREQLTTTKASLKEAVGLLTTSRSNLCFESSEVLEDKIIIFLDKLKKEGRE